MWIISGLFYDLQKGYLKAVELGNRLSQEFGEELEQAVLIEKENDLADYEGKIREWEENNKVVSNKRENQLARDKKVRNGIGLVSLISLLLFPIVALVSHWFVGIETPTVPPFNMFHFLLLIGIAILNFSLPIVFTLGPIIFLIMLLTYNSSRKRMPKLEPKPAAVQR